MVEIFGLNGTLGIFSEFDVLMNPVETENTLSNGIAYKRWELELAHKNSFDLQMKYKNTIIRSDVGTDVRTFQGLHQRMRSWKRIIY